MSLIADSLKNEGYKLRLVNSISELQEKIRIFDNGLDDRVVECLKRLLWEEERVNEAFPYNSVGFSHVETKYGLIDALIIKQVDSNNEALDEFRISYGGSYLPMISMIKRKFHFSEREGVRWKLVDKLYWNLLVKNLDDSRIARV